ncbi:unnamed protein product [Clonostachys chloroleuca]|uniref:Uncharacterized protein n=1 Tax=Clonostachys chloroleuca TaxID=1926264 RepID=A0AA35MC49_9HYPO|nr:unnamed protein product [Clonostachys chloroleuca]
MDCFIIPLSPRTCSRPKDKQTTVEREYLEVAVIMPTSLSSSAQPALNANIQNAPIVTRTGHTKYFAE